MKIENNYWPVLYVAWKPDPALLSSDLNSTYKLLPDDVRAAGISLPQYCPIKSESSSPPSLTWKKELLKYYQYYLQFFNQVNNPFEYVTGRDMRIIFEREKTTDKFIVVPIIYWYTVVINIICVIFYQFHEHIRKNHQSNSVYKLEAILFVSWICPVI